MQITKSPESANNSLTQYLKKILEVVSPMSLSYLVALGALQEGTNPHKFFEELFENGAELQLWDELLSYYCNVQEFYDDYYEEIEELRKKYFIKTGKEILVGSKDYKTTMAYWAYENIAYKLYNNFIT